MPRFAALALIAGCGGADTTAAPDAAPAEVADAAVALPDATLGVPLPGFGDITGACGAIDAAALTGATPMLYRGDLDFARDRYDDPAERPQLTAGGQVIVASDNAGGSSIFSEAFAFELLARCELASLVKLETEIVYDVDGDKTDILVEIDGAKVGVSVTRAVTFPFGSPYTPLAAQELVDRKLAGILESTANVSPADAWHKQILAVLAYDAQHADVFAEAWNAADPTLRADTLVVLFVTDGDDLFIYTDS